MLKRVPTWVLVLFMGTLVAAVLFIFVKAGWQFSHNDDCQQRLAKWGYVEEPHNEHYMGWKCRAGGVGLSPFDWEVVCSCKRWFYLSKLNERAERDARARGE